MCNKGIVCLSRSDTDTDTDSDNSIHYQRRHQTTTFYFMDTPPSTSPTFAPRSSSSPGSNDETLRVKFLCSFLGSIMPRPQDGKLRYVGGETRIVCVSKDITYQELISRMRELYEEAAVLKYQQPDEDLDSLVSVVNDDDVTNMMEEYEKLGSGDGFTRLRIFLFSHPDIDGPPRFLDGDDRETQRRYVDALNNLNDGTECRRQQQPESPVPSMLDDNRFFNQISLDGSSVHGQRSMEMPLSQYNLTIPHMVVPGQPQQSLRYNEVEGSWSPAYYSPRHHNDPRLLSDFPSSPRYPMVFGEPPEEYARQVNHHAMYEHHPPFSENVAWVQEKSCIPGNVFHGPTAFEGSSFCEHCRCTFPRNQPQHEHLNIVNGHPHVGTPSVERQPNIVNGHPHAGIPFVEVAANREPIMLNPDAKLHRGIFHEDQIDPRPLYNDIPGQERGWVMQHQMNHRVEEGRSRTSGTGRLNDRYAMDGSYVNFPVGHNGLADGHHMSPSYVQQANFSYGYGPDTVYPASHGHVPLHPSWRNFQNPVHGAPSYEASGATLQVNGSTSPVIFRDSVEGSPRVCTRVDSPQEMIGFDATAGAECSYGQAFRLREKTQPPDNLGSYSPEPISSTPETLSFPIPSDPVLLSDTCSISVHDKWVHPTTSVNGPSQKNSFNFTEEEKEASHAEKSRSGVLPSIACTVTADNRREGKLLQSSNLNNVGQAEECDDAKLLKTDLFLAPEGSKLPVDQLGPLPELVASVRNVTLEKVEEEKIGVSENTDLAKHECDKKENDVNDPEPVKAYAEAEWDSDGDHQKASKIEPTKAEEEAIDRGLQTIRNDDLEEIRELGSGTYGAVYYGKWKGSDVAIKRIKASCFAGRPLERERLIADFWKEALILSSLHHPNVVSFYGIVRDGPDGSLATVTEFMVNGSLKQFLQKKDRTIDRRKRLIMAMDAAFGMEYLHGKNIVHFDLKCENLLVNMRDPQRPVCKIGDLGLSKVKQHTLVSGGVRGTLPWMAPELLSGKNHMVSEKIDVYSFAIVMWELLTGEEPYADMHCASIIGGIVHNTLRPQIPAWCDPEWKSLMETCWGSDPSARPSFSEISQKLRNMAAAINVK